MRHVSRLALAVIYGAAGAAHLLWPAPFVAITPEWVPRPSDVVRLTGIAEIVGAVGLLLAPTRRASAAALALYAVCVFPANLKHALDGGTVFGLGWLYHAPRLALQPVIVWWTLHAGGITNWPFSRRRQ